MAHGLNLKPSKMEPLHDVLRQAGYETLQVHLSGHRGDEREFLSATRKLWLGELYQAYQEARKRADSQQVPLHFVGYSLGALLNLDLLNTASSDFGVPIRYDRMVLLAPALALKHPYSWVLFMGRLRFLTSWSSQWVIPSLAHPDDRAHPRGTPVAAYKALCDSLIQVRKQGIRQCRVPTLIFIASKDELVSMRGIQALIKKENLENWELIELSRQLDSVTNKTGRSPQRFHHWIIDEEGLGPSEWKRLQSALLLHLEGKNLNAELHGN